ncbi:phage portal protein [Bacillus thuringiensis]|uniref:Phage portal protein n=1 Tax=Bacillus thuringiensis serovar andalousiensis TaxID=257985 RepID=A0A6H0TJV1_BACTU|nr:phage portal protein [Bacillus thuringiensis]QIW21202.1 phage portal protein [Bacillus thuringiensis serovar andalousiensis]
MTSKMKAQVVKVRGVSATTQQIYDDPFENSYENDEILRPPYNLKELKLVAEHSSILQQCIEAYTTNIVSFGMNPSYSFDYRAADKSIQKKADVEWERLHFFLKYLSFDEIPETILDWALADREKTGNGYLEVIRNGLGEPCSIEYMDCVNMRVTTFTEFVDTEITVMENNQPITVPIPKRFRKYVQIQNDKKTFLKEYGDPRFMNRSTGKFTSTHNGVEESNEVIHLKNGPSAYGKPRYLGQLISLFGARKAEELNYYYFKNGRHVPAAVIVENGQLTKQSYQEIQEYMSGVQGVDNSHRFMLLEAEGIETESYAGEEDVKPVKVQIKSLADMLQQDALFLEYDAKTRDKLRSAFRLPPLYTGESQDYNKATAQTAKQVTEEQVFGPQRNVVAGKLTTLFCQSLGLHYVSIILKGPSASDPVEKAKALIPLINAGTITPNDPRDLAGEILGKELEPLTFEGANEKPFQLIMGNNKTTDNPAGAGVVALEKSANKELIHFLKDTRDAMEEMRDVLKEVSKK